VMEEWFSALPVTRASSAIVAPRGGVSSTSTGSMKIIAGVGKKSSGRG
jgi:hypothetical protein